MARKRNISREGICRFRLNMKTKQEENKKDQNRSRQDMKKERNSYLNFTKSTGILNVINIKM